ncbi:hypothetical protein LY76DRAFT_589242 [Colletotrichum caudatum]|nr:hypothetical protein LY76DRAFT_589242 [Colletotrichum caudatum]
MTAINIGIVAVYQCCQKRPGCVFYQPTYLPTLSSFSCFLLFFFVLLLYYYYHHLGSPLQSSSSLPKVVYFHSNPRPSPTTAFRPPF